MRHQEGKIELQKNVQRRICVRDITFLTARPPFYVVFCCFLCLLSPPSQVTYLLNGPYKDTQYFYDGILCDDTMSEQSKICQFLAI